MPVGKERVSEIVDYSILHGDDETCKMFSIQRTALDRYKRTYREYFGESADLLMKLKKQYTNEELRAIANGGRIVPGFKKVPIVNFEADEIVFGVIGDTHFGSIYTDENMFLSALEQFEKNGCQFMVHGGDVVDGMMSRPGSVYELSHIGFNAQRDESIRLLSQWKKPMYLISGNHDDSFNTKLNAGVCIVEEICKAIPNATYLGNGEGDLSINGCVIRLFHGIDPGASYALSYRQQKIIEAITGGTKPNLLISSHAHKAIYIFYRNVHALESGCIQKQTAYMRGKRSAAMTGFWIIRAGLRNGSVIYFSPTFYPFYQ